MQIDLTWKDNGTDETGYEVYRSDDGVTGWDLIAEPTANATTYTDENVLPETQYFYRVRAKRNSERSAYTNVADATTPSADPCDLRFKPSMLFGIQSRSITQSDNTDIDSIPNSVGRYIHPSAPIEAIGPSPNAGINKMKYRTGASGSAINGLPVIQGGSERGMGFYVDPTCPPVYNSSWTFYWLGRMPTFPQTTDGHLWADYVGPNGYTNAQDGQYVERLIMHAPSGGNNLLGYSYAFQNTINGTVQTTTDNLEGVQVLCWVFDKTIPSVKIYRNDVLIFTGTFSSGGASWDITDDFVELFISGDGSPNQAFYGDTVEFWGALEAHDNTTRSAITACLMTLADIVAPSAPSSMNATTASSSQINLTWTDNSSNETGFEIWHSTNNITFTLLTTTAANATSYSHTGLSASTTHYYKVRAKRGTAYSSFSNTDSDTTSASTIDPNTLGSKLWAIEVSGITPQVNGTNVTGLTDTANGNNIVFPSTTEGGTVPTYLNNHFGTKPAIDVTDGDEGEMEAPFSGGGLAQSFTAYFVVDYNQGSLPDTGGLMFYTLGVLLNAGGNDIGVILAENNDSPRKDAAVLAGGSIVGIANAVNGKQVLCFVGDKAAGSIKLYRNKVLVGTITGLGTAGWDFDDYVMWFSIFGGTLNRFVGKFGASYAFKAVHNLTTVEGVSDWLNTEYGTIY